MMATVRIVLTPGLAVTPTWRLVKALRRGAMGEVWIGDNAEGERVAVKFLAEGMEKDPTNVQRFEREWAMATTIASPHVVKMMEHGRTPSGRPFIVMELLEGDTLEDELERHGSLPAPVLVTLLRQVAHALDAAHSRGVVHRDIKPENILLARRDRATVVKVLDFGLAKPWEGGQTLTRTGIVMGTPYYMSPEQLFDSGKDIDHRADLWALAALAYRALFGTHPFDAVSLPALVFEICAGNFQPLDKVGGPAVLKPFFERAFKIERDKRYASAGGMVDELAKLLGLDESARRSSAIPGANGGDATMVYEPTMVASPQSETLPNRNFGSTDKLEMALEHTVLHEDDTTETTMPRGGRHEDEPTLARNYGTDDPTQLYNSPRYSSSVPPGPSGAPPEMTIVDERTSDTPRPRVVSSVPPPPRPPTLASATTSDALPTMRRGDAAKSSRHALVAALGMALVAVLGIGGWYTWRALRSDAQPTAHNDAPEPAPSPASPASPVPNTADSHTALEEIEQPEPPPAASSADAEEPAASASSAPVAGIAFLSVRCNPACIVLIDEEAAGVSPVKKRELTPGPHKVVAYRDDIGAKKLDVDLAPGEHRELDVAMH
jgi:serine/threonine protein kinase